VEAPESLTAIRYVTGVRYATIPHTASEGLFDGREAGGEGVDRGDNMGLVMILMYIAIACP
jgi:hypothetical protein